MEEAKLLFDLAIWFLSNCNRFSWPGRDRHAACEIGKPSTIPMR